MVPSFNLHHIGYATYSIEKTATFFLDLGYSLTDTVFDANQSVNIAFLNKAGTTSIELIEAIDENSPVSNFLNKNGAGPYHICYEVEDIKRSIAYLREHHFIPLFKPVPAIAFDNRLISFLFHKETGLIELLQK